jgi:hypothetical protein
MIAATEPEVPADVADIDACWRAVNYQRINRQGGGTRWLVG